MAQFFPNHHETSKRNEREGGKALETVADRVVAESLGNSRTNHCVNLMGLLFSRTNHCVNLMGLLFSNVFITLRT